MGSITSALNNQKCFRSKHYKLDGAWLCLIIFPSVSEHEIEIEVLPEFNDLFSSRTTLPSHQTIDIHTSKKIMKFQAETLEQ